MAGLAACALLPCIHPQSRCASRHAAAQHAPDSGTDCPFRGGKAVPSPETKSSPAPPHRRGRLQVVSNTPSTSAAFWPFHDACPGLIMLQGNMESTPFWASAPPFSGRGRNSVDAQSKRRPDRSGRRLAIQAMRRVYQVPVLGMLAQGSCGGRWPSCSSSTEMPSGDLTNAMCPSRGGRWTIWPASTIRWQVS